MIINTPLFTITITRPSPRNNMTVHSVYLYQDIPEVHKKYVGEARLVDPSRDYDKCFTISSNNLKRMLDKMGNIITEQVCA